MFMDPTTFGRKKGEKGASAATIQGFFSDLFQGEGGMRGWSEKEIRGFLRQSFEGEEKLSETMVGELAAALETVLDPGAMEWEAEKALRDYVKSGEFGKFYARLRATQDKSLEEAAARASDAGNYTRQLEGILNRVGGIVLAYTEDLADIAEQTAVRQVTSQSRKGFLGFRGGMKNLEEARAVSAQDIGGRRQAMDRELFNQHINSILGLIKSEFLDIGRLSKAQRTVISGPQGFTQGGFQSGIDALKSLRPEVGKNIQQFDALIRTLQLAYNKQKRAIDKDERVQKIKMMTLEIQAKITEQQHRIALEESANLGIRSLLMAREEGKSAERVAELKRSVSAPGALNFLTPMGALGREQGAETAIFDEEKRLRDKGAIHDAKAKLIELQNQAKINRITSELVESNLKLRTSIDALNTTMGGGASAGGTGGGALGVGHIAGGGGNLTRTRASGDLYRFGDKERMEAVTREIGKEAAEKKAAEARVKEKSC